MAPLAGERAKRPRRGVFAMRPPQSKVSGKRAMPAQTITYATGADLEPFCAKRKTLVRAARSALAKITLYAYIYIQNKKNPPDWVGMAPLAGERAKRPRWGVFAMRLPTNKEK